MSIDIKTLIQPGDLENISGSSFSALSAMDALTMENRSRQRATELPVMQKHKCNGVFVPPLPEEPTLPYVILCKTSIKFIRNDEVPVYYAFYSEMPFSYYGAAGVLFLYANYQYKLFYSVSEGQRWVEDFLNVNGSGSLIGLPQGTTWVWGNEPVYLYPDGTEYYPGTEAELVDAAFYPIVYEEPKYQYTFTRGYKASPLEFKARSMDDGTISGSWFKWVSNKGVKVSESMTFVPPTDTLGVSNYYYMVTNRKDGTAQTIYSDNVTVSVVERDPEKEARSFMLGKVIGRMVRDSRHR